MTTKRPELPPGLASSGDEGARAEVRFLHSTGTGPAMWDRTIAQLSRLEAGALAVASLGYPPNEPVAHGDTVTVEDHVAHLARVVPTGPFHLVAHSFGAFLALELLRRSEAIAERVVSLWVWEPVLFGALARSGDAEVDPLVGARSALVRDASAGGTDPWLAAFVDYWNGAGAFSKIPEGMRAPMRRLGWTMYQEVRATALSDTPFEAYRVRCPLTLAFGERSPRASRAMIAALARHNPAAVVEGHPALSHMAPVGKPRDVVPSIEAHLVRAGVRARRGDTAPSP